MDIELKQAEAVVDGLSDITRLHYTRPIHTFWPWSPKFEWRDLELTKEQVAYMSRVAISGNRMSHTGEMTARVECVSDKDSRCCDAPGVIVSVHAPPRAVGFTGTQRDAFVFCSKCGNLV